MNITGVNLRVDDSAAQTFCLWPLKNETPQQKEASFNGFHRANTSAVIKDLV